MKEVIEMFRLFILLFVVLEYAFAMETLLIDHNDSHEVLPYSSYSAVKNMNELPDVLKDNVWYKNKFDFKKDKVHQAYWIKVNIKNSQNIAKELYLVDERRYVYSIEYYLVKGDKVSTYKKDGFYVQDNVSSFNSAKRVFPLSLAANEEAQIFFKVQNYNMLDIPFKIVNRDYLIEHFQVYSFLQGAFFVVLLVMIIYNFITYLIVRAKVYLYYLAYVFSLMVYQGGYFGYLKVFDTPPLLVLIMMIGGGIGFIVFAAIFLKELFQLKKYLPKIDKIFFFILCYLAFVFLLYIGSIIVVDFYTSQFMFNMISLVIPLYVVILLYALYYLAYKKVNKIVYIYAIVWSIVALVGLLLIAMHSNFISTNLGVEYLFEVGVMMESIFFSLLLAYSIKEVEEEKQSQELLLVQQNRLASMGEMISNIAHQWRQPLSQINGRVLVMDIDYRKKILTDERMEEHISDIENTTAYMSATINDFINFFNTKKELSEFWTSSLIAEAMRITKMSSSKKVKFINGMDDVLMVGYKSELLQVLLIVINNGIDAYSGNANVRIIIKVKVETKGKVTISIKDNGDGIPNEILGKVFEPYYTTKHKEQGTGLGLYILKMIIENGMGGKASIKNDVKGTIFTIEVPKVML